MAIGVGISYAAESDGKTPAKTDTPEPSSRFRPGILVPYGATMVEAERIILLATLDRCFGSKPRAAQSLGLAVKTVYNILNRDTAKRASPPSTSVHIAQASTECSGNAAGGVP